MKIRVADAEPGKTYLLAIKDGELIPIPAEPFACPTDQRPEPEVSVESDALRFRWLIAGHGNFMSGESLCLGKREGRLTRMMIDDVIEHGWKDDQ